MALIKYLLARISVLDVQFKYLLRGSAIAFNLQILSNIISLFLSWLLASWIGATGVGIYFQCQSVVMLAGALSRFGLPNALLRFTAASRATSDLDSLAGVCREGTRLVALFSIPFTVVVFVFAPWIANSFFSDEDIMIPLRIMSLGILPQALFTVYAALLRGVEKFVSSGVANSVGFPFFNLVVFSLLGRDLGVTGASLSFVVASVLTWAMSMIMWRRATPELRNRKGFFDRKLLLSTGRPLLWVELGNIVGSWLDTLVIGRWLDSNAVGIYGVAKRIGRLISFFTRSINFAVAPQFSRLFAQNNFHSLKKLARDSSKLSTLLVLPIILVVIVFPTQILGLYGENFATGGIALIIIGVGQFIHAATGALGYILIMTGYEREMRSNSIFGMALGLVLLNLLVPSSGIVGAALASTLTLTAVTIGELFLVYWRLHFIPLPLPNKLFVKHLS